MVTCSFCDWLWRNDLFPSGFHLRGSVSPWESKRRLLIRAQNTTCTPTQQQPTHTHQVTHTSRYILFTFVTVFFLYIFFTSYISYNVCLFSSSISFSPMKFSQAGPFKASNEGEPDLFSPISPPAATVPVTLENGGTSQPIKTPARNKKQKGHQRWEGNLKRDSLRCKTLVRTFFIVYSKCEAQSWSGFAGFNAFFEVV